MISPSVRRGGPCAPALRARSLRRRVVRCTVAGAGLGVAACAAVPGSLSAQQSDGAGCDGQTISDIRVISHDPYEGRGDRWIEAPLRWANALHSTTRASVIRRFLLFEVGESCSERERAESERILRAQPYLAEARVRATPDGESAVVIVVETVDELTPVVSLRTSGDSPFIAGLKLGEGNFLGSGTYVAGTWRDGLVRDTYEARVVDHQFVGRPIILDLHAARRDIGFHTVTLDVGRPFLTDLQRAGWRVHVGDRNDVFDFYDGENEPVQLTLRRTYADVGGILRVGVPGRLSLFGASISKETDESGRPPSLEPGVEYDALLGRFQRRENARVNALWGERTLSFRRVERFDALTAAQDIPLGLQLGILFGRSLSMFGATDDDFLVAGDLYTAAGGDRTFVSLHALAEGRQNYDENEWDGIIASASLTAYRRIRDRHTVLFDADWAGGWKQRIPFQLTLGDRDGGVRGYQDSRSAGARRAVVRLEDRWYVGQFRDQADLGLSFFAEAGRLWAGDAPFGVDTPVRGSVGLGLLLAVPPGSKRNFRLDIAYPLSSADRGKLEFRLTTIRANRPSWREPRDVSWSREQAVPTSVFTWP